MRRISWLLALAIPAIMISCQKEAVSKTETTSRDGEVVIAGNGAPSGAHYSLNIIGVPRGKSADMTGNNGHRIFVPLWGNPKINLYNADLTDGEFRVLDANGTDGSASFQLPNPDPDNNGITEYSVWARALGTPGGRSVMTTCATDLTGETECSTKSLVSVRNKGKSSFDNVSAELLYIYADIDEDGDLDRVPLFDDRMYDYYWQYDNYGLKLLQLRFHEIATDVTEELPDGAPVVN